MWDPTWFAPAVELLLLVPLSIATGWAQGTARHSDSEARRHSLRRFRNAFRSLALVLTAVVSVFNCWALVLLIRALVMGHSSAGPALLLDAADLWFTNVLVFALWFWNLDRGGPAVRGTAAPQGQTSRS
jgi:hypothetical protein